MTWAKEVGPNGRPIRNPDVGPTDKGTKVCPAVLGAANWWSTAFDPSSGLYYIQAIESCGVYLKKPVDWQTGRGFMGGSSRNAPGDPPQRFLRAIDIQTGKITWQYAQTGSGESRSGTLATASGLVFFVMRWVIRYTPDFEKRWRRYEKPVGLSWRCDETYIKVAGTWTYLYRAVDQNGKTVDFFLSKQRDVRAAKTLFRPALRKHGHPLSITLDAYAASHRAVQELKDSGEILYQKMRVRSCAYLNNVIEQDHRRVKSRVQPMLGFQSLSRQSRNVVCPAK